MICFRCGSKVIGNAAVCTNCGQNLGTPRRVTRTITSFKAIEMRRKRASETLSERPYAVGDWIDERYVILDLVGSGPIGLVYRAREQETGLDVALKAIRPELLGEPQLIQDFLDSFRRLGGHDAPDVLRVVPLRDQERVLARSRFITGLSLRKVMDLRQQQGQQFQLHEVGPRIFQLVRALEQLHRSAHHGFLKPSNILLEPSGVRLTDLGLLQALPQTGFAQAQQDAGAYVYLAPEVRNDQLVDARSDVYTVGTVLYELLAGRALTDGAPPLSEILGSNGREKWGQVDSLIQQATAVDPTERFESISDFGDAFAVALDAQALIMDKDESGGDTTVRPMVDPGVPSLPAALVQPVDATDSYAPLPADVVEISEDGSQPGLASFEEVSESAIVSIVDESEPEQTGSSVELNFGSVVEEIFEDDAPTTVEAQDAIVALEPEPERREDTMSVGLDSTPWFLRTRGGFLVAAGCIVGLVGAMVFYYIQHRRDEARKYDEPVAVHVSKSPDAKGAKETVSPNAIGSSDGKTKPGAGDTQSDETLTASAVSKAAPDAAQSDHANSKETENARKAEEQARKDEEQARKDEERKRVDAEQARKDAEQARKDEERKRADAEQARKDEERARKEAERKRKDEEREQKAEQEREEKKARAERKKAEREEKKARAERKKAEREEARIAKKKAKEERDRKRKEKREAEKREKAENRAEKKRLPKQNAARKKAEREEKAAERKRKKAEERRAREAREARRREEKAAKAEAKRKAAEERKRQAEEKREQELAAARQRARENDAIQAASGVLSCPRGMRLIRTARFPKGSIKLGKIVSGEGIRLARAGKAFCIDTHEYPGAGSRPRTNINYGGAKSLCERAGKRLCTGREWMIGCYGRGGGRFPYGKTFKGGVCNTEKEDGSEGSLSRAGRFRKCRSAWGLYDMSGNVAEWTDGMRVRGGDYGSSDDEASCASGGGRSPGTSRGTIGFRCCKGFKE
ncbi:MAG: SUMF1/EgtB/PvdO family nonheme iron enzyme [Myxococcota bacterium]|nr:SUMF1/EgtB/PvdO family nonheme iron enzyme [Myxococcota bacterium]